MAQISIVDDATRNIDMDQQRLPPAIQEIVREVKLLRDNIKLCENTIRLCNARLSTISALCQLFIHQNPAPDRPVSQEVQTLIEEQGQVIARAEEATRAQSTSLATPDSTEFASAEPVVTWHPIVDSVESAQV